MKKYIANMITGFRILGSIGLLLTPVFSQLFYGLYLFCGFTDMIDGTIARKTESTTVFGEKLDSAADLIFTAAAFIKIWPVLQIPNWLLCWILMIGMLRGMNIAVGFRMEKRLFPMHTVMNKITGFLLFILPLSLPFVELKYSAWVVCMMATFSAVQENFYIRRKLDF